VTGGCIHQYFLIYYSMKTARPDLELVARCCHALSDETRLRVVDYLAGGEKCVCDLQALVGAAQSRLSFHLKVLRDAGLVVPRKQGRWVHYSLRPDALAELGSFLEEWHARESEWTASSATDDRSGPGCCG